MAFITSRTIRNNNVVNDPCYECNPPRQTRTIAFTFPEIARVVFMPHWERGPHVFLKVVLGIPSNTSVAGPTFLIAVKMRSIDAAFLTPLDKRSTGETLTCGS